MDDLKQENNALKQVLIEQVKEQRLKRRWSIAFKLIWIVLVVLAFIALKNISFSDTKIASNVPHVAVIEIKGQIDSKSAASAQNINKALNKAFNEVNVKGIILKMNTPGGSPVQAGLVNDEIQRLRKLYPDKPIYTVVEELCASGGYYIAVATENIYVDKASIVGSIGALMNGFGVTELMKKIGIERRLITAGDNKAFMDPFSPQDEKQIQYVKALLNQIHEQFIAAVKSGRGTRLQDNPDIFSGLIYLGPDAIKVGLADDFGSVSSIARDKLNCETLIDYTIQEDFSDRLFRKLGTAVGYGAVKAGIDVSPLTNIQ